MKYIIVASFLLACVSAFCEVKKIGIQEAINTAGLSVEIRGKKYGEFPNDTASYSKSMAIIVTNHTADTYEIRIENGRILDSEEENVQNMVIVNQDVIVLKPKTVLKKPFFAMCTQKHNAGPSSDRKYRLGNICEPNLRKLTQYIQDKKYFLYTAQNAVWSITDNLSPEYIDDDNTVIADDLIAKVCEIKRIPKPDMESIRKNRNLVNAHSARSFYVVKNFKFQIKYLLEKKSHVKVSLFDKTDKEVRVLKNSPNKADGYYTVDMKFNSVGLPDSTYTMKLIINDEVRQTSTVEVIPKQ